MKVFLIGLSLFSGAAFAQNYEPPKGEQPKLDKTGVEPGYEQPIGEQPTFGKKFKIHGAPTSNSFFELNPLLLVQQGIGVSAETRFTDNMTLGAEFQYLNPTYDRALAEGSYSYVGIAPQVRYYPLETLSGVYFGGRLFVGQSTISVTDKMREKTEKKSVFQITPAVHFGGRWVSSNGFTLGGYVGAGFNLPTGALADESYTSDWKSIRSDANKNADVLKIDYGLTVGIAI